MDLEEREGVEPVIQRTCSECCATLTEAEITAALESGGPFLCTVHAAEDAAPDEDAAPPE